MSDILIGVVLTLAVQVAILAVATAWIARDHRGRWRRGGL